MSEREPKDIDAIPLALPHGLAVASPDRDGEAMLVARLQDGQPAAVAQAYDAHHAALRAFCRRLLGDEAAAEDLVHDIFLALPRAVRRFRGDSALRTFVIGMAVNLSKRHLRTAARRRRAMERFAAQPTEAVAAPDQDVDRRRLAALLSRALDALPLDQRAAFVLCEVEQRTSREVGEILAVPQETVRTRLFHARKKLRVFLEKAGVR